MGIALHDSLPIETFGINPFKTIADTRAFQVAAPRHFAAARTIDTDRFGSDAIKSTGRQYQREFKQLVQLWILCGQG